MRLATLILIGSLLAGCSWTSPELTAKLPATYKQTLPTKPVSVQPTERFQLTGSLLTPPEGSIVEVALLLVDPKGRPKELLGSTALTGTGQPLPFTLGFSRDQLPAGLSAELRARVSLSGQLTQRLPGKPITTLLSQNLGALQLVIAP